MQGIVDENSLIRVFKCYQYKQSKNVTIDSRDCETEGKGKLKKGREYHCKEESQKTITVVEETRNENENLNFWDWYKSLVEERQVLSEK